MKSTVGLLVYPLDITLNFTSFFSHKLLLSKQNFKGLTFEIA